MWKAILLFIIFVACTSYLYHDYEDANTQNQKHMNRAMIDRAREIAAHCRNVAMDHPDYMACLCYQQLPFYTRLKGSETSGMDFAEYKEVEPCGFVLPSFYEPSYTPRSPLWKRVTDLLKTAR